jgi:hypothetical protein
VVGDLPTLQKILVKQLWGISKHTFHAFSKLGVRLLGPGSHGLTLMRTPVMGMVVTPMSGLVLLMLQPILKQVLMFCEFCFS